jgi:chaperonin GroES
MWNPNEDRVVLKPIDSEKKSKGGIIIPPEAQKISEWEVLAVGPTATSKNNQELLVEIGRMLGQVPQELKQEGVKLLPGMRVMISDAAGMDIEVDGEKQRVVRFIDIHLYNEAPTD